MEFQTNPDIRFITNEAFEAKIKQIEIEMYHEQVLPKTDRRCSARVRIRK